MPPPKKNFLRSGKNQCDIRAKHTNLGGKYDVVKKFLYVCENKRDVRENFCYVRQNIAWSLASF